jgi:hypothetical protein
MALSVGCTDGIGPELEGAPFLAAHIDGIPWTVTADDLASLTPNGKLVVWGITRETRDTFQRALGFQFSPFHGAGTYSLSYSDDPNNVGDYTIYSGPLDSTPRVFSTVGGNYSGQVRITAFNPTKRLVAGTFTFTAVELGGNAAVHITDGSFRVRYY